MNTTQKNAIISVATLVFAGLALWGSQDGGEMTEVPWLLIGGLGVVTLLFGMLQRWRQAAPPTPSPAAKKKSRKR